MVSMQKRVFCFTFCLFLFVERIHFCLSSISGKAIGGGDQGVLSPQSYSSCSTASPDKPCSSDQGDSRTKQVEGDPAQGGSGLVVSNNGVADFSQALNRVEQDQLGKIALPKAYVGRNDGRFNFDPAKESWDARYHSVMEYIKNHIKNKIQPQLP